MHGLFDLALIGLVWLASAQCEDGTGVYMDSTTGRPQCCGSTCLFSFLATCPSNGQCTQGVCCVPTGKTEAECSSYLTCAGCIVKGCQWSTTSGGSCTTSCTGTILTSSPTCLADYTKCPISLTPYYTSCKNRCGYANSFTGAGQISSAFTGSLVFYNSYQQLLQQQQQQAQLGGLANFFNRLLLEKDSGQQQTHQQFMNYYASQFSRSCSSDNETRRVEILYGPSPVKKSARPHNNNQSQIAQNYNYLNSQVEEGTASFSPAARRLQQLVGINYGCTCDSGCTKASTCCSDYNNVCGTQTTLAKFALPMRFLYNWQGKCATTNNNFPDSSIGVTTMEVFFYRFGLCTFTTYNDQGYALTLKQRSDGSFIINSYTDQTCQTVKSGSTVFTQSQLNMCVTAADQASRFYVWSSDPGAQLYVYPPVAYIPPLSFPLDLYFSGDSASEDMANYCSGDTCCNSVNFGCFCSQDQTVDFIGTITQLGLCTPLQGGIYTELVPTTSTTYTITMYADNQCSVTLMNNATIPFTMSTVGTCQDASGIMYNELIFEFTAIRPNDDGTAASSLIIAEIHIFDISGNEIPTESVISLFRPNPGLATDGDESTFWTTPFAKGNVVRLTLNFNESYTMDSYEIVCGSDDGGQPTRWQVYGYKGNNPRVLLSKEDVSQDSPQMDLGPYRLIPAFRFELMDRLVFPVRWDVIFPNECKGTTAQCGCGSGSTFPDNTWYVVLPDLNVCGAGLAASGTWYAMITQGDASNVWVAAQYDSSDCSNMIDGTQITLTKTQIGVCLPINGGKFLFTQGIIFPFTVDVVAPPFCKTTNNVIDCSCATSPTFPTGQTFTIQFQALNTCTTPTANPFPTQLNYQLIYHQETGEFEVKPYADCDNAIASLVMGSYFFRARDATSVCVDNTASAFGVSPTARIRITQNPVT